MIGKTITHYTILEKLGEGGMGVVYKARDKKLDRFVALKFLSTTLSTSGEDRARFIQEAKSAAALDHPNICTIFGIEEYHIARKSGGTGGSADSAATGGGPGVSGGKEPQLFFAMSFVEGTTLREKIPTLSLRQAVEIGIQMAEGLAAAHAKGIIHRDIKPENIMIRKDGIVQIMDFGLARLREHSSKIERLTKAGSTVGTAGYMSPEQVLGQDADHRADIFSFGVVLYELFTGQLPFKGVHETALAYEIVNIDPASPSSVKAEIGTALDAVVMECLAKEPSERFQSAAEIAKELRRYKRESGRSRVSTVSTVAPIGAGASATGRSDTAPPANADEQPAVRPGAHPMKRERLYWMGALLVALAAFLFGIVSRPAVENPDRISVRFTIPPPENTVIEMTTVSPDGKILAFTATGGGKTLLWIRTMKSLEPRSLPGTENAIFPFWSPDSRFIGFFAEGSLKKINIAGGTPLVVCDARDPVGGTWNAAGDILFGSLSGGVFRVPGGGGIPVPATTLDSARKETSHSWPAFLPDGRHFLFTSIRVFDEEVTTYLTSLDDTSRTAIITADANVVFTPPDRILFLRNRTLMSQKFDLGNGHLIGDPSPVTVDVGRIPRFAAGDFSYSPAGVLTTGTGRSVNRQYAWFDRNGKNLGPACPPGNYFDIALSPSGKQAAVQKVDVQTGNSDIWIIDLVRKIPSRFTFDPAVDDDPVWSADGGTLYFSNASGSTYNVYRRSANGVGATEAVLPPGAPQTPDDWSADGAFLLFEVLDNENGSDLWVMPADSGTKPYPFIATSFDEYAGQFSPDGRWVAYTSNESGRNEVYVQSFPNAGGRWQVSVRGGARPRWRPDGRELFYVAPNLDLMSVEILSGPGFEYGIARKLFTTRIDNYIGPNRYVVSVDGKRFLINIPLDEELKNNVTVSINPFDD